MRNATKHRAFTLIELLVVIGVIGILAGIILGVLPAARNKTIRSTAKTELAAADTAINRYKAKHNFYPPDNKKAYSHAQLFYELTGTVQEPDAAGVKYKSINASADPALTPQELENIFGVKGFLNTAPVAEQNEVANFWENLPVRQVRDIPASKGLPAYKILTVSRHGMDGERAPLFYNSSSPTNNPGEFDLWVEIELAGK